LGNIGTGRQLEQLFTQRPHPAVSRNDDDNMVVQDFTGELSAAQQQNNTEFTNEQLKQIRDDAERRFYSKKAAKQRANDNVADTTNLLGKALNREQDRGPSSNTYSISDEQSFNNARKNALLRQEQKLLQQLAKQKSLNGGKPRTRKHHRSANQQQLPRYTTIRKRSKHPVNQRRKYTRKARQDCVSGSTKRTKRVKNNLG
jgi:hypothetical protein